MYTHCGEGGGWTSGAGEHAGKDVEADNPLLSILSNISIRHTRLCYPDHSGGRTQIVFMPLGLLLPSLTTACSQP
jgi:hypothetical protein